MTRAISFLFAATLGTTPTEALANDDYGAKVASAVAAYRACWEDLRVNSRVESAKRSCVKAWSAFEDATRSRENAATTSKNALANHDHYQQQTGRALAWLVESTDSQNASKVPDPTKAVPKEWPSGPKGGGGKTWSIREDFAILKNGIERLEPSFTDESQALESGLSPATIRLMGKLATLLEASEVLPPATPPEPPPPLPDLLAPPEAP